MLSLSKDQFSCNCYIFKCFCNFYNFLYSCVHKLYIIYLVFSFNTRYYYYNCRFNARWYFERALVLLDDNVVENLLLLLLLVCLLPQLSTGTPGIRVIS